MSVAEAKESETNKSVASSVPGKDWTVADIPSQAGRRALITGANSGIGYYAGLELTRKGAHVLLGCRDKAKGDAARERIRSEVPGAIVDVVVIDLASLKSVCTFVGQELELEVPLDLLINNAGVMAPKNRQKTSDGFELQFGTNVLGHFALTALLLPALERAAAGGPQRPRVVTLASIAHKNGRLNFDDLQWKKNYSPMGAYQQSKLADLIFAFELGRRLRTAGSPKSGIMSVAAHPGVAGTSLFVGNDRSAVERLVRRGLRVGINTFLNTEAAGALPTLFAATAAETVSGGYYGPQGFREMRGGDVGLAQVAEQARDQAAATRLWNECERLTGMSLL